MSDALDVRYTAKLARLNLSEEDVAKFQSQLAHILDYVEKLREVNVDGVELTAQHANLTNVFRVDSERDWFSAQDALANAPRQANDLFLVPKVIE
jgi:aspartyl-tRNA(Asn)/glutamyl-tRNA(Gln) amidotransferase subunit C